MVSWNHPLLVISLQDGFVKPPYRGFMKPPDIVKQPLQRGVCVCSLICGGHRHSHPKMCMFRHMHKGIVECQGHTLTYIDICRWTHAGDTDTHTYTHVQKTGANQGIKTNLHICVIRACWVNLVGSRRSWFTPYAHSIPKGCGPCLSNTRFDECRVWATQLTYKHLKYMKSRHPGEPWMCTSVTNK